MGICKKFLKKVAKTAAIAYVGYQAHDYVEKDNQVIVKPNIYLPEQAQKGVSLTEIVFVITVVVAIAILAVLIKIGVKAILKKNNRIPFRCISATTVIV